MSSWRQIASANLVITDRRKLSPGGMWVLANVTQGRQGRPLLFPLLAFIEFLSSLICSHISFIWDLPKYLLNGREALGIQS